MYLETRVAGPELAGVRSDVDVEILMIRNYRHLVAGMAWLILVGLALYTPTGWAQRSGGGPKGGGRSGMGGGGPQDGSLKAGDQAPDFTLKDPDGKEVKLSSFQGQKPVFLAFGSYT